MSGTAHFEFRTVGIVRSPFPDKFAVPRQPGLAPAAEGRLYLHGECNRGDVIRGLADFSHLWITFVFHQVLHQGWKPTVRPPRLGGNRRLGVFATRSPFRPNPIGLSVVELKRIEERERQWCLVLGGVDMVDGTPVLDIKPYVPYVDAIPDARGGFTDNLTPETVPVLFSPTAREQVESCKDRYPNLAQLIQQVIAQRPQPAYHGRDSDRLYGMALYDLNISWRNANGTSVVESIDKQTGTVFPSGTIDQGNGGGMQ